MNNLGSCNGSDGTKIMPLVTSRHDVFRLFFPLFLFSEHKTCDCKIEFSPHKSPIKLLLFCGEIQCKFWLIFEQLITPICPISDNFTALKLLVSITAT